MHKNVHILFITKSLLCISDYGQVINCLDVSNVLVMYLSTKAMYKYMARDARQGNELCSLLLLVDEFLRWHKMMITSALMEHVSLCCFTSTINSEGHVGTVS